MRQIVIGIFELAGGHIVKTGGREILAPIFERMLGIDYPRGSELPLQVWEDDLARAIYPAHSTKARRVIETLARMIRDGVLELDLDRVSAVTATFSPDEHGSGRCRFSPDQAVMPL